MAPVLLVLLLAGQLNIFKWLLAVSFFTDAIDGIIARRTRSASALGSRLDSIGDDMTFAVAVIGLIITRPLFIFQEWFVIAALLALFFIQLFMSLSKYGRISSFHTYLAKAAAILQATFLLSAFFCVETYYPLFYTAAAVTALDLLEEIMLVRLLPTWQTDVKGLYWIKRKLHRM